MLDRRQRLIRVQKKNLLLCRSKITATLRLIVYDDRDRSASSIETYIYVDLLSGGGGGVEISVYK